MFRLGPLVKKGLSFISIHHCDLFKFPSVEQGEEWFRTRVKNTYIREEFTNTVNERVHIELGKNWLRYAPTIVSSVVMKLNLLISLTDNDYSNPEKN